jgi:hypothetical protein
MEELAQASAPNTRHSALTLYPVLLYTTIRLTVATVTFALHYQNTYFVSKAQPVKN